MKTNKARTEALARFLEFENRFDEEFKIADAAIAHVARMVGGVGGPSIMQGLVRDAGDLFREDASWEQPREALERARGSAALLAIVQIHSAIDDFCVQVEADQTRCRDLSSPGSARTTAPEEQPAAPAKDSSDQEERVSKERMEAVCERLGWSSPAFDEWRPLLLLFRAMRDCVAHRSGVASKWTAELAASAAAANTMKSWARRQGAAPPELPVLAVGEPILVRPKQVILCLEVAHRVAVFMNERLIADIGDRGIVCLAAHYGLIVGTVRGRSGAFRTPETVINEVLTDRYRVTDMSDGESTRHLREIGLWERCVRGHRTLFGEPPVARD